MFLPSHWMRTVKVVTVHPVTDTPIVLNNRLIHLNKRIAIWENTFMPRKYNTNKRTKSFDTWFANCKLTQLDKDKFEGWFTQHVDDLDIYMSQALTAGNKLSVTYSEANGAFCASFTCKDDSSPNYGGVLTSWSGDWMEAVFMGFYKITVLLADQPWPTTDDIEAWG